MKCFILVLRFGFIFAQSVAFKFFSLRKKASHRRSIIRSLQTAEFQSWNLQFNFFLLQEGLEGFEEVTNPKGIVLNPETNEDVDMGEWRTSHFGHLTILPLLIVLFFPHLCKFNHDSIDSNWINFEFVIPDCLFHFSKEAQGD